MVLAVVIVVVVVAGVRVVAVVVVVVVVVVSLVAFVDLVGDGGCGGEHGHVDCGGRGIGRCRKVLVTFASRSVLGTPESEMSERQSFFYLGQVVALA